MQSVDFTPKFITHSLKYTDAFRFAIERVSFNAAVCIIHCRSLYFMPTVPVYPIEYTLIGHIIIGNAPIEHTPIANTLIGRSICHRIKPH